MPGLPLQLQTLSAQGVKPGEFSKTEIAIDSEFSTGTNAEGSNVDFSKIFSNALNSNATSESESITASKLQLGDSQSELLSKINALKVGSNERSVIPQVHAEKLLNENLAGIPLQIKGQNKNISDVNLNNISGENPHLYFDKGISSEVLSELGPERTDASDVVNTNNVSEIINFLNPSKQSIKNYEQNGDGKLVFTELESSEKKLGDEQSKIVNKLNTQKTITNANDISIDSILTKSDLKGLSDASLIDSKQLHDDNSDLKTSKTADNLLNGSIAKNNDFSKQNGDIGVFNRKQLGVVKAYGNKQDVLNDNIIKNVKDFSEKESKGKKLGDENLVSDLKIAQDLKSIHGDLVPATNLALKSNTIEVDINHDKKVLDLSKIDISGNSTEVIKKISNYIEQSNFEKSQSLDLLVRHDSLGQFNIEVSRPLREVNQNIMELKITTQSQEAHQFFSKNENQLIKNLNNSGIQLSDFKIVSGGDSMNFSQSDSQSSKQFSSFYSEKASHFGDGKNYNSSEGNDRRRELWKQAEEKFYKYGA